MMIFVCDKDSIIETDWVPNGITVIAAYYQTFFHSELHP